MSLSHVFKNEMRDNQKQKLKVGKTKNCENLKEDTAYYSSDQGKNSESCIERCGTCTKRGKRKKPGKIMKGLEDCKVFKSKINLIHFG